MSLIRPAAQKHLHRFRDALIGAAICLLGLYWAFFTGTGPLHWIGYAVALAGGALTLAGLQRARFARGGDGPGVLRIKERQIGYFGPENGGILSLDSLLSLQVETRPGQSAQWILSTPDDRLTIPADAHGADALFDVLQSLPGADTQAALRALDTPQPGRFVIWRKASARPGTPRLH